MVGRIVKNRSLAAGGAILLVLVLTALLGPSLAPHDPLRIDPLHRLAGPGGKYPLGTDHLGRCVCSRLLFGARISLSASLAVSLAILILGLAVGFVAGLGGPKTDLLVMRLVDIKLAFPSLILTLAVIGALGPSLVSAALGIVLNWWPVYARMVRGLVLAAKEKEYVLAARVAGSRGLKLVRGHLLPQVLPPALLLASLETGSLILVFAGLGFLGLGVQAPTPEWGTMLSEARHYIYTAPHLLIAPGAAIFLAVLGFNLLGEGLREVLNLKEAGKW